MLQSFVNSLVFAPPDNTNSLQAVQLLQHKRYMEFVRKKDGQVISYYHIAPDGGRVTEERLNEVTQFATVMLFHHGNAEDLGGCYHYTEWCAASFGVAVVMYDYCGYGLSGYPGKRKSSSSPITEKTVYSDADDMYGHLLKLGYPAHRIIVVGRSVGGGPACYLAQKHHKEIAGLILISTFTSCLRVVSTHCLPYFCGCVDVFHNHRRVEEVMECPVLVMHGTDDNVVPYHCSCELLETIEKRRQRAWAGLQRHREKTAAKQRSCCTTHDTSKAPPSASSNTSVLMTRASGEQHGEPVSVYDLYQRAYAAIPESIRSAAARTVGFDAHEVQIGTFHKWFQGCGHNDIEHLELQTFAQAVTWFTHFAKAFSVERGSTVGRHASSVSGVAASRE
ncbi:serine peptidase putative serine peptidase Clan SC Family S9D [Leptomonas seymouri]|uniref:Serine peptidase putative serine peptidase Clan SC Family S9D n=1 Tax=Leptomonas seymouri TaxID=5684 RepID=A0A0N0P6M6_LEPSE|nr:serine peptidase putative serine peptidase Clan SC Family S9D [Leptomonas seymouri]|eukprot:KPI87816.1 serine peptidase putative serine peptidase Clan SC Family S9D [Leptomonas seymouri]